MKKSQKTTARNGQMTVRKQTPARHKSPKSAKGRARAELPPPADAAPYHVRLLCEFPTVIAFTFDAKDAEEAQETAKYLAGRWCKVVKVKEGETPNPLSQLIHIGAPYPKFTASIISQCQKPKILDVRSDRFPKPSIREWEELNRRNHN